MDAVVNALVGEFPYQEGDFFDQTVSGPGAPVGQGLAYIRLDHPLSEDQEFLAMSNKWLNLLFVESSSNRKTG